MEFPQTLVKMRGERTQEQFARDTGLAVDSIRSYECGRRRPGYDAIAALLRVATPEQAQELLEVLGMDVEQLRAAILASLGVATVTVAMGFERQYLDDGDWESVDRATVKRELGFWYIDGGDRVMEVLETSARTNAPEPGKSRFTPQATYRATVTATVGGNGSGDETEGKE